MRMFCRRFADPFSMPFFGTPQGLGGQFIPLRSIRALSIFLLPFFMMGCGQRDAEERNREPVARAFGKTFYQKDLNEEVPEHISKADSAKLARRRIMDWVREQVLLEHAETELTEEELNLEERLADYRRSLLVHHYQKKLVKRRLDSTVTEADIRTYYEENSEDFQLDGPIVRMRFLRLDSMAPALKRVSRSIRSGKKGGLERIEEICRDHQIAYRLRDERWYRFSELPDVGPFKEKDPGVLAGYNKDRVFRFEEDDYLYFVKLLEFKTKKDTAPLEMIRERIRRVILNKRKQAIVEEARKNLMERAKNAEEFEVY